MAASTRKPASEKVISQRSNTELWVGLLTALVLTLAYLALELVTSPLPSDPLEHLMGVVGIVLMLFTEVGYMARKRFSWLRMGSLSGWLSVHIVTGIVGSALVLLHSTFKFHGLALIASIMTGFVVGSGFLGRYLYTAIPRTVAGIELDRDDLAGELQRVRAQLNALAADRSGYAAQVIDQIAMPRRAYADSVGSVMLRAWDDWLYQRRVSAALQRIDRRERAFARQLVAMQRQVRQAERQLAMLGTARKLMGLWHVVHVPMGLTLFGSALIHVIAVYYYGAVNIP
jgi:hypothetical protein